MSIRDQFEELIRVAAERALTVEEAGAAMAAMAEGAVEADRIRAFLTTPALAVGTVTAETLAGLAGEVRARAVALPAVRTRRIVDTCGTGGGASTFNVSTAAALVVAAVRGGSAAPLLAVAKHGNRAVASRCGSADVLEELGVRIENGPEEAVRLLDEIGFCFLFAPAYHRAFAHVMPVRKELAASGVRTAFNLVGPLANPARATHQVVGVFSPDRVRVVAEALRLLGTEAALVVCGRSSADGIIDEIAVDGPTTAVRLAGGRLEDTELTPETFGRVLVSPGTTLHVADRAASARLVRAVLAGEAPEAAMLAVELNAAAALAVALEIAPAEAADRVRPILANGEALQVLDALRVAAPRSS